MAESSLIDQEEWRPAIVANYEVSNHGRVRRSSAGRKTFAGRILKLQLMVIGYMSVRPTVGGVNVTMYVHDLVASAFVGPRPDGCIVNHKDTNKANNFWRNLEYTTHAGNMKHAAENGLMVHGEDHPSAKLDEASVRLLRADRAAGMSFSRLSMKHGICISQAWQIATGNAWRHSL